MSNPGEGMQCPECSAPFEVLTLYLDPSGPFYGCDECGWIEPHGPGVWTAEEILHVVEEKETDE